MSGKKYRWVWPWKNKDTSDDPDELENIIRSLRVERDAIIRERNGLERCRNSLDSLCQLASEGYRILGIEQLHTIYYVVLMTPVGSSQQDTGRMIYLYRLPFSHRQDYICKMGLHFTATCSAYISDWASHVPNMGYGSMLMKHLISFLRSSGFRTLTGSISPVDYDHEEKLRHFYTKFGFKITDCPDRRALHLDILETETKAMFKDNCLVCCRSNDYQRLSMEALLANDGE